MTDKCAADVAFMKKHCYCCGRRFENALDRRLWRIPRGPGDDKVCDLCYAWWKRERLAGNLLDIRFARWGWRP